VVGLPKSIIKKYGITKKAWRVYRGNKKTSKTTKKRSVKAKVANRRYSRKKTKRRGSRIFGNVGIKGLVVGTGILTLAKYLARRFLPVGSAYVDGLAMVGAGFSGISGTGGMKQVGLMDVTSELVANLVLGKPMGNSGGYDF